MADCPAAPNTEPARDDPVLELAERWEREADDDLETYGVVTHLGPYQAARELRAALAARGETMVKKEARV